MNIDEDMQLERLFSEQPGALGLYRVVESYLMQVFPGACREIKKTQITFKERYGFAFVWPPRSRVKGRAGSYIVVSFGLGERVRHPRIVEAVEPYPGRWTHHVLLERPEELDDQLKDWLRQSWSFAQQKSRRK